MSYRRKTCECCRARLSAAEDYWCDDCRDRIVAHYHVAMRQLQARTADGLTPKEAVRELIGDLVAITKGDA